MSDRKNHLPIFGVGPIYVLSCLCLTVVGLTLHYKGYLNVGEIEKEKILFKIASICFILFGIFLWVTSVLWQKIGKAVHTGKLVTDGIYGVVRNPIYSAFVFIFTGMLLFTANVFLLLLPFVFWAFLTTLMKCTEEKWLEEKFGEEYVLYCKRVNRVIPWFPKNET